ncbi:MAG: hypothetical protein EZS28_013296, partial [Streblomastix strix]
ETTTRKNGSASSDKHSNGEDLFRQMAGFIGLDDDTVVNLIGSLSGETWRKRRAGLRLFSEYVEERVLKLEELLGKKSDIVLANALTWRAVNGGVQAKVELRKIITHAEIALGMFASKWQRVIGTGGNSCCEEFGIGKRWKCQIPNCVEYREIVQSYSGNWTRQGQNPHAIGNGVSGCILGLQNDRISGNEKV